MSRNLPPSPKGGGQPPARGGRNRNRSASAVGGSPLLDSRGRRTPAPSPDVCPALDTQQAAQPPGTDMEGSAEISADPLNRVVSAAATEQLGSSSIKAARGPLTNRDPATAPAVDSVSFLLDPLAGAWQGPAPWLVLATGIDTLETSCAVRPPISRLVDKTASLAQSKGRRMPIAWRVGSRDWSAVVHRGGGRGASYVRITAPDWSLMLPRSSACQEPAQLKIFAEALWAHGPRRTVAMVLEAVATLCYPPHERQPGEDWEPGELAAYDARRAELADPATWKISRVDFCADMHAHFDETQAGHWHCKARDRATVCLVERHEGGGGRVTSWVFGKGGAFMARIYDKRLEIRTHDRMWMVPIWERSPHYSAEREVWRVEFQCRREGVRSLMVGDHRLDRIPDAFELQANAWRYLAGSWLWLDSSAKHDKGEAMDDRWRVVRDEPFKPENLETVEPAKRCKVAGDASLARLLPQLRGLRATVAAVAVKAGRITAQQLADLERPSDVRRLVDALLDAFESENRIRKDDELSMTIERVGERVSPMDDVLEEIWGTGGAPCV